jgi:hypothetical protein
MVSDVIAVFTVAQPDVAGTVTNPVGQVYFKPTPLGPEAMCELHREQKRPDPLIAC